jgi:copper(I)-binding protein
MAGHRQGSGIISRFVEEQLLKLTQALAGLVLLASAAVAQQTPLVVLNAWVRATPGTTAVAAAYLTLKNVSTAAVTVTSIESPIAGHAMIHETTTEGGQSRMRPFEHLVIAPGSVVKFEPGGLHVMLHDLKQPLTAGQTVPLVIKLAGGPTVQVTAAVRPLTAE